MTGEQANMMEQVSTFYLLMLTKVKTKKNGKKKMKKERKKKENFFLTA